MTSNSSTNILASMKNALGIPEAVTSFDNQLIMHINAVFIIMKELGIGPSGIFTINEDTLWTDYLQDSDALELVKSYMYLRLRLIFDPPATSFVLESINHQISEFEWRLNALVDPLFPESEV